MQPPDDEELPHAHPRAPREPQTPRELRWLSGRIRVPAAVGLTTVLISAAWLLWPAPGSRSDSTRDGAQADVSLADFQPVKAVEFSAAGDPSTTLGTGVTSLPAFNYAWETLLVPFTPRLSSSVSMFVLTSGSDTMHRVMLDRRRKVYFGYDIRVLRLVQDGQPDRYQLTFSPLTVTDELRNLLGDGSWTALAAPQFPPARTLQAGETLEMTLLTNAASGQRVAEQVAVWRTLADRARTPNRKAVVTQIVGRAKRLQATTPRVETPDAPRNITAADVPLELVDPQVSVTVGDRPATLVKASGKALGPVVWVYIPRHGRFLLSLVPRPNFVRAGTTLSSRLTFTADGANYRVSSQGRIAPALNATVYVYVRREPEWKPDGAGGETASIGSQSLMRNAPTR